ncbi:MAG: hypothetical protein V8S57_02595 [Oscillospiraceae bacterium]
MAAVPIAEGNNLLDFANWIYRQSRRRGRRQLPRVGAVRHRPAQERRTARSGARYRRQGCFGCGSVLFTKFQGLFTKYLKSQLNDLLVKIVVSMSVDNNCPDDNDMTILLEGSNAQARLFSVTCSSAATTQAYVQGDTATATG